MAWITPKTDWTSVDGVADEDMNRIEGNTAEAVRRNGDTIPGALAVQGVSGISAYGWATMSSGPNGDGLFGNNCYIDVNTAEYKYRETHGNLGARGFAFRWGFNGSVPYYFDMGNVATVANQVFVPVWRRMWHSGIALTLDSQSDAANSYSRQLIFSYVDSTGTKQTNRLVEVTPDGTLILTHAGVASYALLHQGNTQTYARGRIQLSATDISNNTTLQAGLYTTAEANLLGLPWSWAHAINLQHASADGYNAQIFTPLDNSTGPLYFRNSQSGVWSPFRKLFLLDANDNARLPNLLAIHDDGTSIDASLHIKYASALNRFTQMHHPAATVSADAVNLIAAKDGAANQLWWSWGVNTAGEFVINSGIGLNVPGGFAIQGGGNAFVKGSLVWTQGNDGSGSGLDADIVKGQNIMDTQFTGSHARSVGNAISLAWRAFGDHQIFDASAGFSPSGSSSGLDITNASIPWSPSYPNLMGWNNGQTFGVRVDSARNADRVGGGSITKSTAAPSGGVDGDIWMQYS